MRISLEHISKKFQRHWILKELTLQLETPDSIALLGPNGSGKSTLLRIIAAIQPPSKGKVIYEREGRSIEPMKVFPFISFAAPGMEIIEELTLTEFFSFHFQFKRPLGNRSIPDLIREIGLEEAASRPIADYSSGMKQRVKLAQAIFADTPVLLLDEPCTNLDQKGVDQYRRWIADHTSGRMVVVASNDPREYDFCKRVMDVTAYK